MQSVRSFRPIRRMGTLDDFWKFNRAGEFAHPKRSATPPAFVLRRILYPANLLPELVELTGIEPVTS
jgi:hypothetical protein